MDPGLVDRLRDALLRGPRVAVAILFGSRARGSARPDSDVDVAIQPTVAGLSAAQEAELATMLERGAGATVDLVRIDEASPALRWRIARDGIVLWSDPPTAASRFRAEAAIAHDEMRELEREAARRYRAHLARPPGPQRRD